MDKNPEPSLQEMHEMLMNHVILPRFLPQNKSKNHHQDERALLACMMENIDDLSKWIPRNTVKMFHALDRINRNFQPAVVSKEIRELKCGETFAMFVRRQNCAIMIHIPLGDINSNQTNRAIVSWFPGNLHPKNVYNADSDIQVRN